MSEERSGVRKGLAHHFKYVYTIFDILRHYRAWPDSLSKADRRELLAITSSIVATQVCINDWPGTETPEELYPVFLSRVLPLIPDCVTSFSADSIALSEAVRLLHGRGWEVLYEFTGPAVFQHLLEKTRVLIPVAIEHDRWFQIAGPDLSHVCPQAASSMAAGSKLELVDKTHLTDKNVTVEELVKSYGKLNDVFPGLPATASFTGASGTGYPKQLVDFAPIWEQCISILPNLAIATDRSFARLLDRYCPVTASGSTPRHVAAFVCASLEKLCSRRLLGSPRNWGVFKTKVISYLGGHKKKGIPLVDLVQGIRVTEIDWLGKSSSRQGFSAKTKLLKYLIFWIFTYFVPMLTKRFFHVSMSPASATLTIIRLDVWYKSYCQQVRKSVASLRRAPDNTQYPWKPARIHFVPKVGGTGLRSITNLKAIRSSIQDAHAALGSLKPTVGTVIRNHNDFVPILFKYKQVNATCRNFYIVKVDVANCYDAANQQKLLEILSPKLAGSFLISEITTVKVGSKSSNRRTLSQTRRTADILGPQPLGTAVAAAKGTRISTVATQKTALKLVKGRDILNDIKQLLTRLLVEVQKKHYIKCQGIPQGSKISSSLCDILYTDLLEHRFKDLLQDSSCLLARYVDDFLFVSTTKSKAELFLNRMETGFPDYGVHINQAKTLCNFGNSATRRITYLGLDLDCNELDIVFTPRSSFTWTNSTDISTVRRASKTSFNYKYYPIFKAFERARISIPTSTVQKISRAVGAEKGNEATSLKLKYSIAKSIVMQALTDVLKQSSNINPTEKKQCFREGLRAWEQSYKVSTT